MPFVVGGFYVAWSPLNSRLCRYCRHIKLTSQIICYLKPKYNEVINVKCVLQNPDPNNWNKSIVPALMNFRGLCIRVRVSWVRHPNFRYFWLGLSIPKHGRYMNGNFVTNFSNKKIRNRTLRVINGINSTCFDFISPWL